jgi:hypothetical protein
MRDSESKRIGEHTYTVRMLTVDTAIDVLVDLVGMLGEPVAELLAAGSASDIVTGLREEGAEDEESGRAVALLLRVLVGKLHKDTIHGIVKKLVAVSDVDNVPLTQSYAAHFRGELCLLAKWLWFALQVQYRDFSGAFEAIAGSETRQSGQELEG